MGFDTLSGFSEFPYSGYSKRTTERQVTEEGALLGKTGEAGDHRRRAGDVNDVIVTRLGFEPSACVARGPTNQYFVDAVKSIRSLLLSLLKTQQHEQ